MILSRHCQFFCNISFFQQTIAKVLAFFAPQLGVKGVDTADITSIPEEVIAHVGLSYM